MEKFILLLVATMTVASSKDYRSDYVYNRKTDAFYKLHISPRRGWLIKSICEEEGAKLMVPLLPDDIAQVHGMMKRYPEMGEYAFVENDGQEHTSAEVTPIIDLTPQKEEPPVGSNFVPDCLVLTRGGSLESMSCYKEMPFVCKVYAKDAPYDAHCGTYSKNYHYESTVGSCYRVSKIPYSWDEAYAECRAENAHLVVINSEAEREVVHRLIQAAPRINEAKAWFFYYAGFRAEATVGDAVPVFKTVFNETLEQAGCVAWSPNEPNNSQHVEYCGTIFANDGKFNDVNCAHRFGFICEKNKD